MSMTKEQAYDVIKFCMNAFDVEFNKSKLETWTDLLMSSGDYEGTMKKAKRRAVSDNPYKPILPEIIEKPLINHNAQFFDREEDKQNKALRKDKDFMAERRRKAEEYQRMAENGELTIHDL